MSLFPTSDSSLTRQGVPHSGPVCLLSGSFSHAALLKPAGSGGSVPLRLSFSCALFFILDSCGGGGYLPFIMLPTVSLCRAQERFFFTLLFIFIHCAFYYKESLWLFLFFSCSNVTKISFFPQSLRWRPNPGGKDYVPGLLLSGRLSAYSTVLARNVRCWNARQFFSSDKGPVAKSYWNLVAISAVPSIYRSPNNIIGVVLCSRIKFEPSSAWRTVLFSFLFFYYKQIYSIQTI